jgi:uncharacterized membrane protein YoaK (UPF0700 family)
MHQAMRFSAHCAIHARPLIERSDGTMLIRQGDARNHRLDRRLAFTLAAVAGSVNAAAFHAVGFFSANMTGNVSSLSSLLALGQWQHGLGYLIIVLTFIGGAMVSTLLIDAGLRRAITTIYARVVLAEAVLLVLLGTARSLLASAQGVPLLIMGLSFLMGLQNAIVTHISDARVRTTHVSGMSTDIGIALAKLLASPRNRSTRRERGKLMAKLHLHTGTILAFLAGGVLGVIAYRWIGDLSFALSALPLALVSLPAFHPFKR